MSNAREIADLGTLFDASNNLTTSGTVTADAIVPNGNVTFTTGDRVIGNGDEKIKFDSTNQDIEIQTADSVAMLIDSSQRVLIGSTSSVANDTGLQVNGEGFTESSIAASRFSNNGSPPHIIGQKSRSGTIGGNTVVQNDDVILRMGGYASDGVDMVTPVAVIDYRVDGTPGSNDMPGRLEFYTTSDGSNSATERMRITNEGEVIVAGTNTANSKLYVSGGINTGDNGLAVSDSSEASGYKMLCLTPPSIPAGGSISMVFTGFNGDAPYAVKFRYGGFSGAVTQPNAHCGFSVEYIFNGTGNMNSVIETFEYGEQFNSGDVSISGAGGGLLTLTIQHHGAHSSSVGFRCWLIAEVYGFAAQRVYLQSQS